MLFAGAILAVYSFIGFGDMAQTAEEVRDVKRNLPRAMMISLGIVFRLLHADRDWRWSVRVNSTSLPGASRPPLVKAVELVRLAGSADCDCQSFRHRQRGALTQIIASVAAFFLDMRGDSRGRHPYPFAPGLLSQRQDRGYNRFPGDARSLWAPLPGFFCPCLWPFGMGGTAQIACRKTTSFTDF